MSDKMTRNERTDNEYVRQTGSLKQRLARVKTTRWIRFGIVAAIYVGWTIWMGNPWLLLGLLLLGDIYLTQFLPWGAWKGLKNGALRTVMSWIDAIVYALVLVYFLFLFVGQNYQIPSSSLEKTLLTGDFLWVNKIVYGPRVPQTPLHFPLSQNTLPFFNCKSYIEKPQLAYHRLKGLREIERGDIVVFNFPAGDTVALKCPNPDYYTLVAEKGREAVWNNPQVYGKVVYRPVDRRDNYVKRCLGLPGEILSIEDGIVNIDGIPIDEPANVQYKYLIVTNGTPITDMQFDALGVSVDDRNGNGNVYEIPLTAAMVKEISSLPNVTQVERMTDQFYQENAPDFYAYDVQMTHPTGVNRGWTHNNYGPVTIPSRDLTIDLTDENVDLYRRCICNYEGNTLVKEGEQWLLNGEPAEQYTFKMNYYWMMGDNRDNSLDSRYWGFVPEDHIVGTPVVILISFDKDHSLFNGGIRWNRIFKKPNPDKL